jgi:hypothetical protein
VKEDGHQKSPVRSRSTARDPRDAPAGAAVSGPEGLLGLASSLGNAGFGALAGVARAEGGMEALMARSAGHASNSSIARLTRDMSERRLLRQVPPGGGGEPPGGAPRDAVVAAADFLRTHLGDPDDYAKDPLRQGRDMEAMLRKIARRHPGLAAEATRLADGVRDARAASEAELGALTNRARDVITRSGGGADTPSPRKLEDRLRRIADEGGHDATEAGALADQMRSVRRRLNEITSGVQANYTDSGTTSPKGPPGKPPVASPDVSVDDPATRGQVRAPRGGGGAGGPSVGLDPSLEAGGGARTPSRPRGGTADLDEGGTDITGEEVEATSGVTHGPTLLGMVGQWLIQDFSREQQAKIDAITTKQINDQLERQVKDLAPITIALQSGGNIAYVQVTIKETFARMGTYDDGTTVRDLEAVRISEWFRQEREHSSWEGVTETVVTNSFAQPLHPMVIDAFAAHLNGQMRDIDAQLRSSPSPTTELQQRRARLERCITRLRQKGPHVPSFAFLGGECLDVLPMGTPPPA